MQATPDGWPLVSVVVPTRNSASSLASCLHSIRKQDYDNIELLVVDNDSSDATLTIAHQFADKVHTWGPERSSQRNFGASQAQGIFLLMIDSDMELSSHVISQCVALSTANSSIGGIIIPEMSRGEGFWARCKALEKTLYLGVQWMEAARFFPMATFDEVGGYDEGLVGPEDWDLSQRLAEVSHIGRIDELIYHNEGALTLRQTIKKKAYYARQLTSYSAKEPNLPAASKQLSTLQRFRLFFRARRQLFADPVPGLGLLFMKTAEFGAAAMAVTWMRMRRRSSTMRRYLDKALGKS
jgi:glycosyltransferase involved in cell wall biosynthesis